MRWGNPSKERSRGSGFSRLTATILGVVATLALVVSGATASYAATTLRTYAAPAGPVKSTDFTVKVRIPGGSWTDLDEYQSRIGGPSRASFATFVSFDTDGPVEISATYNLAPVSTVTVRPSVQAITPIISGNTATFTISGPTKLVVDVNGNVDQDLMIFANPLETDVPSATDPNVVYYGPGFYDAGDITVPSGKTLYLAGGAVVKGGVIILDATNVVVRGRGILLQPAAQGFRVENSSNITIDGIIVNGYGNANNGGSGVQMGSVNNVSINNVKLLAYKKWTDGVNESASNSINVNDSYIRTGDDSISIYGSRFGFYGGADTFNVTNSILMPGKAHPINVGTHGNPDAPDTISNITVSNVDILTHNPLSPVAPISFAASDDNLISNTSLSDIRWEDAVVGKFIDFITYKNPGYGLSVGRGVNGVTIKNFSYNGTLQNTNDIYGNSSTRLTQNIAFQGLTVNGAAVTNAAAGNFAIGNYTSNITFGVNPNAAIQSGHVYKLQNVKSGKVLGITGASTANGAQALQWSDNGTSDHLWTVTQLPNGSYTLTNVNSGKVLGVNSMSTSDGANTVQFTNNGTVDHEWKIVSTSTGAYKIVNRYSSKLLAITGGSTAEGAKAVQWIDSGSSDQRWNLVLVN